MSKEKKPKPEIIDGWGNPKDVESVRKSIRQAWMWSRPRAIAKKRCINTDGFYVCEKCGKVTPKIQIHHLIKVGSLDSGFIERLFCPSIQLQCLCPKCHNIITKEEKLKIKNYE